MHILARCPICPGALESISIVIALDLVSSLPLYKPITWLCFHRIQKYEVLFQYEEVGVGRVKLGARFHRCKS